MITTSITTVRVINKIKKNNLIPQASLTNLYTNNACKEMNEKTDLPNYFNSWNNESSLKIIYNKEQKIRYHSICMPASMVKWSK